MNPVSPAIVALVRGAVLAVGTAAAGAITIFATDNSDTLRRYWWGPLVLIGARSLEGLFDKLRGQAPQAGLAGGKPANPADYTAP